MRVAASSLRRGLGVAVVPSFSDVPADHPWLPAVEWMKTRGISLGCETGKFCPERPATRGEVAVFLYRALGSGSTPDAAATAGPDDAAAGSTGISIFGRPVSPWAAGGAALLLLALIVRR